jgi:ABC-type uncharacterized transport system
VFPREGGGPVPNRDSFDQVLGSRLRGRKIAFVFAALALLCCGAAAPAEKHPLHVMTGLPLFWGEGGVGSALGGARSPLLTGLDADYRVIAVDRLEGGALDTVSTLLMIQPPSLSPHDLVALDDWVRRGGQAIILADPDLIWPSSLPLGDRRRAPVTSLLDPLFGHWGVKLEGSLTGAPVVGSGTLGGKTVRTVSAGHWSVTGSDCIVGDAGLTATCSIGKGRAFLVADADLADPRLWTESGQDNLSAIKQLVHLAANSD